MEFLGIELYEWDFAYYMDKIEKTNLDLYNLEVMRYNIQQGSPSSAASMFIGCNEAETTARILSRVRYVYEFGYFTENEWRSMKPYIEEALLLNKEYKQLLEQIAPHIESFCDKYKSQGHYTLMERFKLEFWEGRFNDGHWLNKSKKTLYG